MLRKTMLTHHLVEDWAGAGYGFQDGEA